MIYVLIEGGNNYCGGKFAEAVVYENGTKEYVWADEAFELARRNAESYSDYTEQYYENIEYSYREITREEYLKFCEENNIIPVEET